MNEVEQAIEDLTNAIGADCLLEYPSDKSLALAIQALREKKQRENPEPLTMEQLRKMDGEPLKHWVWIEILDPDEFHYDAISGYYRTSSDFTKGEAFCCGWPGVGCAYDYCDYGKTWLAYAHKPKEVRGMKYRKKPVEVETIQCITHGGKKRKHKALQIIQT